MVLKDKQHQAERFKIFTKDMKWTPKKLEDIQENSHFESLVIIRVGR